MARLPRQAHFVTVLSYRPNDPGMPAEYRGPLYFEFDGPDSAQACEDLRRCVQLLESEYGCSVEAIRVWHSGSRGPHVVIPSVVIGADAGHPKLPRIYSAMIQQLFPPSIALSLDRSIYNMGKGRMWRLPNRRRSDTGRYKVPLAMREVLHKSYGDLEALTQRPRKGLFWPSDDELSPCPALMQLYRETVALVEQGSQVEPVQHDTWVGSNGDVDLLLSRCAFIRHCRGDAASLSEPEWFAMVSNVSRCADGLAAVHELSTPYPGYSPQETDAKLAHALQDTGPHTCALIQAQGFTGCPPGGCGVQAPIGLSHRLTEHADRGGIQVRSDGLRVRDVTGRGRCLRTVPATEVAAWHG
ncbi:MAG: hypothetical protein HYZ81_17535 [Nitrospinae bacterium]|nr:hypothetical protein [Nitrospinota bacterium]